MEEILKFLLSVICLFHKLPFILIRMQMTNGLRSICLVVISTALFSFIIITLGNTLNFEPIVETKTLSTKPETKKKHYEYSKSTTEFNHN